jgi:hypothetical protein
MLTELFSYLDMLSEIQNYKINCFKNLQNNFNLKNIIIFGLLFPLCMILFYFFIIVPKKSLLTGFIVMVVWCLNWDICLFSCFDKAAPYFLLLLYDFIVVAGGSVLISQYLLYNYYDILKNYTLLIFIIFLFSFYLFCYACYKYNPDLSNIKGVALF